MGDATQCSADLPGSAVQTVVLSFELLDYEIQNGPRQIAKALESKAVMEAIEKALKSQADAFLKDQQNGQSVDAKAAASKMAAAVGNAVLDAGKKDLQNQVEKSSAFQSVKDSLDRLQCSYQKSPIGVWVDEHKGILYVVASGLAVGGVTAMYLAKAGDAVADPLGSLAQSALKEIKLGKITLGVTEIKFVPSEQEVKLGVSADTSKWKGVPNIKLAVSAAAKDEKITSFVVQTGVRFPVPAGGNLSMSMKNDMLASKHEFTLDVNWKPGALVVSVGANAVLGPANAAPVWANPNLNLQTAAVNAAISYNGKLGDSIPFNAKLAFSSGPTQIPDLPKGNIRNDTRVFLTLTVKEF